jgi:hypothetical protein
MMSLMREGERGAALVVSLIMLVLITLLVIAALNLGASNFRAVSNTQFRQEAIAAANFAIQNRVSSSFDEAPAPSPIPVDIDHDGTDDYDVIVTPTCLSAYIASSADPSSLSLPPSMTVSSTWNTVWDIAAEVSNDDTGAAVVVHAGVRVLLDQTAKDVSCP